MLAQRVRGLRVRAQRVRGLRVRAQRVRGLRVQAQGQLAQSLELAAGWASMEPVRTPPREAASRE
ncbi:MAG: hypothetical protein FWD63_07105 [Propionibacteriaceae bacterium]|nr:hypothetical protein [Propionibacteriaceae bacterium]